MLLGFVLSIILGLGTNKSVQYSGDSYLIPAYTREPLQFCLWLLGWCLHLPTQHFLVAASYSLCDNYLA